MNQILLRMATEEEVRQALFMMHPEKAPGPDGMTALFFSIPGMLFRRMWWRW